MIKYFCKNDKSNKNFSKIITSFKSLSDENRLKTIYFLKDGEKCVCEIVDFLDISQNLVSHHLKILRKNAILQSRKDGLKVFYSINRKNISNIINFLTYLTMENLTIQVFGSGCPACKTLYEKVSKITFEIDKNLKVTYITDITKMIELGAMSSPVFAIDNQIIIAGRMPSDNEIREAILDKINI